MALPSKRSYARPQALEVYIPQVITPPLVRCSSQHSSPRLHSCTNSPLPPTQDQIPSRPFQPSLLTSQQDIHPPPTIHRSHRPPQPFLPLPSNASQLPWPTQRTSSSRDERYPPRSHESKVKPLIHDPVPPPPLVTTRTPEGSQRITCRQHRTSSRSSTSMPSSSYLSIFVQFVLGC
jgi:hypothetical protein